MSELPPLFYEAELWIHEAVNESSESKTESKTFWKASTNILIPASKNVSSGSNPAIGILALPASRSFFYTTTDLVAILSLTGDVQAWYNEDEAKFGRSLIKTEQKVITDGN